MKYDIQIIIPVSAHFPYTQRLENFKKYALQNVGDKKVLLTLLIGLERMDRANEGWPDGVDVEIVGGQQNHHASKIIEYFLNYQRIDSVRWVAKFDDDCLNDITNLVDNLDKDYDHTGEYYVVTEFRADVEPSDTDALHKAGYSHWVESPNRTSKGIYHELEGSIISNGAMKKILKTPDSIRFLKTRIQQYPGHTDVPLAHAARMAKICASEAWFITQHPLIGAFSYFGNGPFNHIHYVAQDRNPRTFDVVKRLLLEPYEEPEKSIYEVLRGGEFIFAAKHNQFKPYCIMNFMDNGIIRNTGSANESIWLINGKNVEILNDRADPTTVLEYKGDNNYMEGRFLQDPNVTHFIRRLK